MTDRYIAFCQVFFFVSTILALCAGGLDIVSAICVFLCGLIIISLIITIGIGFIRTLHMISNVMEGKKYDEWL